MPSPLKSLALTTLLALALPARAQTGGELHFCLHGEPKTFNPILVDDEASENVRYLTGGVLIRLNRQTQALEPALSTSWKISRDLRTITLHLRKGIHFSDGTPFSSEDVAYTMRLLMDPETHSPTGDAFRSGEGTVQAETPAPDVAAITFPAPIAGLERLFDQVAILSAHSPKKEMAVLGPFYVADCCKKIRTTGNTTPKGTLCLTSIASGWISSATAISSCFGSDAGNCN